MLLRLMIALSMLLIGVGCSAPKQTFAVEVTNLTPVPLSTGMVKRDGRVEPGFAGPEHIFGGAPQIADRKWGTLVMPGETKLLGPETASFEAGTDAVLRVYGADATINELIGYSKTDRMRLDIFLWPGQSRYIVELKDNRLVYRADHREQ